MKNKKLILQSYIAVIICLIQTYSLHLSAQSRDIFESGNNRNAWTCLFHQYALNSKWSVHSEFQWRRNQGFSEPQQELLRFGLNYHLPGAIMLTAGYGFIHTYPYGVFPSSAEFPEHRIWQQIQFRNTYRKSQWINRLRLEQRWINLPVINASQEYESGPAVFSNRIRILNRYSRPIFSNEFKNYAFYITAYDEMMVQFGSHVKHNIFDQNRLSAGVGYQIPILGRIEISYLLQSLFKSNGTQIEQNHTLVLAIYTNMDRNSFKRK